MVRNKVIVNVFVVSLLLLGCNKPPLSMMFENVFLTNDKISHEEKMAIFYVKVTNETGSGITINRQYFEKGGVNSGFFLISDRLYPGAIKLNATGQSDEKLINPRQTAKIIMIVYLLKVQLIMYNPNAEKASEKEVRDFLEGGDYSLVYISEAEPGTLNVQKAKSFKTIVLGPQPDTLSKILSGR